MCGINGMVLAGRGRQVERGALERMRAQDLLVVLDDAVVHQRDPAVSGGVRVRVDLRTPADVEPARVERVGAALVLALNQREQIFLRQFHALLAVGDKRGQTLPGAVDRAAHIGVFQRVFCVVKLIVYIAERHRGVFAEL